MNRLIGKGSQLGQNALGLAQRITQQNRGLPKLGIVLPPAINIVGNGFPGGPTVHRQCERGLGHQGVAGHDLKRLTARIRRAFVVASKDPNIALILESHLSTAQNMAGAVKRNSNPVYFKHLAIGIGLCVDLAEAYVDQRFARGCAEILPAAPARMIAMGVGNHGPFNAAPRVDIKISGWAVQTLGSSFN